MEYWFIGSRLDIFVEIHICSHFFFVSTCKVDKTSNCLRESD